MSDFCGECGAYRAGKPLLETQRDPKRRGWNVYVSRPTSTGGMKGETIFVRDDDRWSSTGILDLMEGVEYPAPTVMEDFVPRASHEAGP